MENTELLGQLGLDTAAFEEAEAQEVRTGGGRLDAGAYKAELKELCTFDTTSGAKMFKAVVNIISEEKEMTVYQNITKKDGQPNPIGTAVFKAIMDATQVDKKALSVATEKVTAYGKEVDAQVLKGITGKVFVALVRAVHEEGADFPDYNEIEGYVTVDGNNSKGENLVDKFNEKIASRPVVERKAKEPQTDAAPKTEAAKNIAGVL